MLKNNNFKQLIGAAALMSVVSVALAGSPSPSVLLTQTVGTDLTIGFCAASSDITINLGTSVNFCYTVTNDGTVPFDLHNLETSAFGAFSLPNGALLPTESMQFNDIRTLASDVFNNGIWMASSPTVVVVTNSTGGFEDISATGALVPELTEDGVVALVIPFSFDYFGTVSTDLHVGNNGAALFGVTSGTVDWQNNVGLATVSGMIAPFWDDLGVSAGTGQLYTETLGSAPNRRFIVQWHQQIFFSGNDADNITFQMALYEGTNEIQFRYFDVIFGGNDVGNDSGQTATIGLISPDGIIISEYSHNGSVLLNDNDLISYTFTAGLSAFDSSLTTVDVLVPQVVASPNAIVSSLEEGATTSTTLDISNSGEGELDWSLNESSVAKTLHTRPISLYTPETTDFPSQFADYNYTNHEEKFVSVIKSNNSLKGNPIAYAFNIRHGFFGSLDYTNPDVFNQIVETLEAYYGADFIGRDYTKLYAVRDDAILNTIDTATGDVTFVAAITGGAEIIGVSGMSEDPTDGTVYISTTDVSNSHLYTLDITTGVSTLVGEVTNSPLLIDIAVSPTGNIYGFDISSDNLIAIDKVTGAGTVVGHIGINASFAQGMDFDNFSNTLYLAAYIGSGVNEIRTIDVKTGVSTLVGSVNQDTGGGEFDAFAIVGRDEETCYLQEDVAWLSLATTSGTTLAGNIDQVTINIDATGLSAGMYNANICVFSNDPDEPLIKVPVDLEVTLLDLIFANGFEASL